MQVPPPAGQLTPLRKLSVVVLAFGEPTMNQLPPCRTSMRVCETPTLFRYDPTAVQKFPNAGQTTLSSSLRPFTFSVPPAVTPESFPVTVCGPGSIAVQALPVQAPSG